MAKAIAGIIALFLTMGSFSSVLAGDWTAHGFIYKPSPGARGTVEKSQYDSGQDRVDARLNKEIWVGDPGSGPTDFDTIPHAVTKIGSTTCTLRVPAGTYSIAAGLVIPTNVTLKPERGALLNVTIPDVNIEGLAKDWPCTVTWTSHGLSTGDKITFSGITQEGWKGLNGCAYTITRINDNSFSIPVATYDNVVFPSAYDAGTDPGNISKVLDIRGGLEAGKYQVFSANPGKVVIGKGKLDKILPQWWGAVTDGVTDCAAAIQAAFYAMETGYGGQVHFPNGVYYVGSSVTPTNFNFISTMSSPLVIKITGDNATLYTDQPISILKRWPSEATCNWYTFGTPVIDGLRFKGTSNRLQVGLDWGGSYSARITNCRFEKLGRGLRLSYAMMPVVENCMTDGCVVAGYTVNDGYGLWSASHNWGCNTDNFKNCRASLAWANPVAIENMSAASTCVVTWTNHGLATGDVIYIDGITQTNWTALNKRRFQITKLTNNTFSLKLLDRTDTPAGMNTSTFGAYVPGTDPGTIQASVYGFEIVNSGITMDTCIIENGNATDHIFFYHYGVAGITVHNQYNEGTPYGSALYINCSGGEFHLDNFGSLLGAILIDTYDMSSSAYGIINITGLYKTSIGTQKIRLPQDYQYGALRWKFLNGGTYGLGWDMHNPVAWYGGNTPLWGLSNNNVGGFHGELGRTITEGQMNYNVIGGMYVKQEPMAGPGYIPPEWFGGLRCEANNSGGGGVGAYDSTNKQAIMIKQKTTEITSLSAGATHTWTNGIPAGSLVVGVTVRVTEAINGPTSFAIGDGTTANKFGTGIAVAKDTTGTLANMPAAASPTAYPTATNIVLTATGGTFTGGAGKGKVRITVHYITLDAPAS